MFARPYSARLPVLPAGLHEELGLLDLCGFRGRPAALVMAVADVGLQGISDRVYETMVSRYRVCIEVAGRHMESFFT